MSTVQTDAAHPSVVHQILRDVESLRADVSARALTAGTPGLRFFARGRSQIFAGLERLEHRTRLSVWNMQVLLNFDPSSPAAALDSRSKRRGIETKYVLSEHNLAVNPLIRSLEPKALVGPVAMNVLISDSKTVLFPGPCTAKGEATVWVAAAEPLVEQALDLWLRTEAVSRPIRRPDDPLLSGRQIEVAKEMCRGRRDVDIAARLGISVRSTEREVQQVVEYVGARCRAEAVFRMMGGPRAF